MKETKNRQKSSKYKRYKKKCGEAILVTQAGDEYKKIVVQSDCWSIDQAEYSLCSKFLHLTFDIDKYSIEEGNARIYIIKVTGTRETYKMKKQEYENQIIMRTQNWRRKKNKLKHMNELM